MLVILGAFILAGTLYDILVHQKAIQRVVQSVKEKNPYENFANGDVKTQCNVNESTLSVIEQNGERAAEENVTKVINNEQSEYFCISNLFLGEESC